MRNTLMISSILALSLGVAGAQTAAPAATTAAPATTTQVTQFSDVPAGHWAKDAVDKIVSCGLIQGFPDGTYRGNENLTRYQAALIFHRLLTTDALSKCGFSGSDMTTVVNGMQEVSTELAAISTRVGDLEKANADQQARITALEGKIANLDSGAASTDVTALTARVTALEDAVKNIPAGPQGPKGDKGDKGDSATTAAPVSSTTVVTPPSTVIVGDVTPAASAKNYYAGVNVGLQFTNNDKDEDGNPCNKNNDGTGDNTSYCVTGGGVIGAKNLFGPIGARIAADYQPGHKAFSGDIAATYNMDLGTNFGVYAGLGVGVTSSPKFNRSNGTDVNYLDNDNTSDVYGLGLIGVEYMATDSIGVYLEGNGRYYFSNKGYGTNRAFTADDTDKGFNGTVKAGVKFYF